MHHRRTTEAGDSPHHRGSGDTFVAEELDDRFVQRPTAVAVAFADENPQQPSVLDRPHGTSS
jgi:hypothetical protein